MGVLAFGTRAGEGSARCDARRRPLPDARSVRRSIARSRGVYLRREPPADTHLGLLGSLVHRLRPSGDGDLRLPADRGVACGLEPRTGNVDSVCRDGQRRAVGYVDALSRALQGRQTAGGYPSAHRPAVTGSRIRIPRGDRPRPGFSSNPVFRAPSRPRRCPARIRLEQPLEDLTRRSSWPLGRSAPGGSLSFHEASHAAFFLSHSSWRPSVVAGIEALARAGCLP